MGAFSSYVILYRDSPFPCSGWPKGGGGLSTVLFCTVTFVLYWGSSRQPIPCPPHAYGTPTPISSPSAYLRPTVGTYEANTVNLFSCCLHYCPSFSRGRAAHEVVSWRLASEQMSDAGLATTCTVQYSTVLPCHGLRRRHSGWQRDAMMELVQRKEYRACSHATPGTKATNTMSAGWVCTLPLPTARACEKQGRDDWPGQCTQSYHGGSQVLCAHQCLEVKPPNRVTATRLASCSMLLLHAPSSMLQGCLLLVPFFSHTCRTKGVLEEIDMARFETTPMTSAASSSSGPPLHGLRPPAHLLNPGSRPNILCR